MSARNVIMIDGWTLPIDDAGGMVLAVLGKMNFIVGTLMLAFFVASCAGVRAQPAESPPTSAAATPILTPTFTTPPTTTSTPTVTATMTSTLSPSTSPSPSSSPRLPTDTPTTTASQQSSAAGLTLTVTPGDGGIGSGVRIEGSVAAVPRTGTFVTITFGPVGPHRSLGDRAHTTYTGPVWPSTWQMHLDANGHFADVVKVPRVIQAPDGNLWLIEPGEHHFSLVVDAKHTAVAPFRVTAPPPPPTTLPPPTTQFQHLWLANAGTGWLTGTRCQEQLPPTPDANGNVPNPAPPRCQGLIETTTNGGQAWQQQYLGNVQITRIQFVGTQFGWALGQEGEQCPDPSCPSALLRTIDGGTHWTTAYTSTLRIDQAAFTSPTDGWLIGQPCTGRFSGSTCALHLLVTSDGGQSWRDSSPPISGFPLSLAHPTTRDGWIATSDGGSGPDHLIVTHDGGQTWQSLTNPTATTDSFGESLFFLDARDGWILAAGQPSAGFQPKAIYRTTDGGQTWTQLATSAMWGQTGGKDHGIPGGGYVGPLVFTTTQDAWIASARGGLLRTTDGGQTWSGASINSHYFVDVSFADPKNGWALSIEGPELWATTDEGATWKPISLPKPG